MDIRSAIPFIIIGTIGFALLVPGIVKTFTDECERLSSAAAFCCWGSIMFHSGFAALILFFTQDISIHLFGVAMDLGFVMLAVIALIMIGLLVVGGILGFHRNFIVGWLFAFLINVGAIIQGRSIIK